MLNRLFLAISAFLVIFLPGCHRAENEALARQASRPGVWVLTEAGLAEISQYGARNLDPFSQEISFKFDRAVPQAAAPQAFVANLPGAALAESQVFLLPSLDAGKWHRHLIVQGDSKAIPSDADAISAAVYKVTPDLPKGATGFLCLWVKMSETDDRLYAVQIK